GGQRGGAHGRGAPQGGGSAFFIGAGAMGSCFTKPADLSPIVHLYRRSAFLFKHQYEDDPLTGEFFFSDCIAHLERALEVTQTTDVTFMELGCGVGLGPVIAKTYGLTAFYGVDINRRLIDVAERNLAHLLEQGLLPHENPPVYIWGNFFTKEQLAVIRDEVRERAYPHLILENPYSDSDVYEQLGILFDAIDVFYMYPFYKMDFGCDYFFRFFRQRAKKGAVLLLKDGRMERK
ncbi:MAG: hypothetical protein ACE5H5_07735, partial [Nitrospinota bacterium]